ncbi:MAG TPA: hypothetical protein VID24_05045 [Candidatus Eremiobacteraceae bacterium]
MKKRTYSAYLCVVPIPASSASAIDALQGVGVGVEAGLACDADANSVIAATMPAQMALILI